MSIKRNGSELIELFAQKADINAAEAKSFIQALSDIVTEVAISEGKATITGFGRFTISEVADREGTQPGTGESIIIPAHKRMNFTPYKNLAEMVNQKYEQKGTEEIGAEEMNAETEEDRELNRTLNKNSDTITSDKGPKQAAPAESKSIADNELDKEKNDSFAALLDEIESKTKVKEPQTTPQTGVNPPKEFTPDSARANSTASEPEQDSLVHEDEEKTELINELDQLIKQKEQLKSGSSLDIRLEDEEPTELNNAPQEKSNTREKAVKESANNAIADKDFPKDRSTRPNRSKKFLPVEEDLLKDFMSSMDELNMAIKSINTKTGGLRPQTSNAISFDKKLFIPGSFIGALLLLVSGFLLGTNADRLFGQQAKDQMNNAELQSNQTNPTTTTQDLSSSTQLAGIPSGSAQSQTRTNGAVSGNSANSSNDAQNTNGANSTAMDASNDPRTGQILGNNTRNNVTSSENSTLRRVSFNSEIGLYNMALEIYGNPRLWVLLFEENFSTNQNPDDIADGTPITIPEIAAPGSFTELEKERLRIALLHVAQAYENAGKNDLAQSYRSASVYYPNTM